MGPPWGESESEKVQVLVTQSCLILCESSLDCSPPGSSVHGILQGRILEWAATPPPGDLPNQGIKPTSLMSLSLAGGIFTTITTWEARYRLHL